MKNLDKTLWIKRIFMVLMDICIVILTSITALIVRFEFSLSAVPKYYIGVVCVFIIRPTKSTAGPSKITINIVITPTSPPAITPIHTFP